MIAAKTVATQAPPNHSLTMPTCCGRSFTSNGIRNHLDNSSDHYNEIECRWCYARWPTHDGKLRLAHEKRNHWVACDDCDYIFENDNTLQEHREEEHPPNYCYGCQRRFMNLNNLNQVWSGPQRFCSALHADSGDLK